MENIDVISIKSVWGNYSFDHAMSSSVGNSGGILCIKDPSMFIKDHVFASDYFLAIIGTWVPSSTKLLVILVYAPQELSEKRELWSYLSILIDRWEGETVILGDFNEVRVEHESSPATEFQFHKGLKSGDPLSPFLFILVIESLHISFNRVLDVGLYKGLKINIHKSKLARIGVSKENIDFAATFSPPFNYLGIKNLKSLSIGGRYTLIKSVLTSIPIYHLSFFKVPAGILKEMESFRRNFFNEMDRSKKKMVWIRWEKNLASKKNRGLGISSFFATNRALLFKWMWRFITQGSSLWSNFIKAIHGDKGAIDNPNSSSRTSIWLDLIRELSSLTHKAINLIALVKRKLGNKENTLFWEDIWLGDSSLKTKFSRLFALEFCKDISVAEKIAHSSLNLSFRRLPRGGAEDVQYRDLCSHTYEVHIPNMSDR
ncbi:RNA-directed DNA polymerase, eukaryota, reverse transcriptase zinc-binding domain protein [Tanacetum coccineum]